MNVCLTVINDKYMFTKTFSDTIDIPHDSFHCKNVINNREHHSID
jgi:hypothetical protein